MLHLLKYIIQQDTWLIEKQKAAGHLRLGDEASWIGAGAALAAAKMPIRDRMSLSIRSTSRFDMDQLL